MKDPLIERGLPANPEAERACLGAVILDNRVWDVIGERLHSDDFSDDRNRRVWEAIKSLRRASPSIPVDYTLLVNRLLDTGELDKIGGMTYLSSLTDGLPRAVNAEHYSKIVEDKAVLRRLIHTSHNITQQALDSSWSEGEENARDGLAGFLDRSEAAILNVRRAEVGGPVHVSEIVSELTTMLAPGGKTLGVSTGFPDLDNIMACGGWPVGEYNVLGGFSQTGKTAFLAQDCRTSAERGELVVIFSVETLRVRILLRMACQMATVNIHQALRKNEDGSTALSEWDLEKIKEAMAAIATMPIVIDDTSDTHVRQIASRCRRIKAERGKIRKIYVDYLQLLEAPPMTRGTRNDELAETNRLFKALAKEMDCPVIVLSQLVNPKDKEGPPPFPQMSMIRDSGTIREQAYNIILLHQDLNKPGIITAIVAKNKDAQRGQVELSFNGQYMQFGTIPQKGSR